MKRLIVILSGLLIVQLVLAITMNLSVNEHGAFQSEEKLLAMDSDSVDRVQISDGETEIVLHKQNSRWVVPQEQDFPADTSAVEQVLAKLSTIKKGWPIATSSEALDRFKVSDEVFEYKLSFFNEDKQVAELYIGTSPGFRKVHARPGEEDKVFSISFDSWRISTKADDWIDKHILKLEKDDIASIEFSDVVLTNESGQFKPEGIDENEVANQAEIDSLVSSLTGLQFNSLSSAKAEVEKNSDASAFTIKVKTKAEEALVYQFSKLKDADNYLLQRSDRDQRFNIAGTMVEKLLNAKRDQLISVAKSEDESEPEPL